MSRSITTLATLFGYGKYFKYTYIKTTLYHINYNKTLEWYVLYASENKHIRYRIYHNN